MALNRFHRIADSLAVWADMVKLSHSVFALPFALTAAFMAGRHIEGRGVPHWGQLGLIVVCMVSARAVAMTFNRIVDAALDARNPRTSGRPLPAGRISMTAAWTMLALTTITFGFGCLGFGLAFGNSWPMLLSGPVLVYLCAYSFTKQFTRWSHLYLGSAIALSPPAAWLAIDPGSLGVTALGLTAAVTCWIGGFDIIYACQDIDVDRREGLFSLPAVVGPRAALAIARALHVGTVLALFAVGWHAGSGGLYFGGVSLVAVLLLIENLLVRSDDFRRISTAFFTINGIVSLIFAATAIGDVLLATLA